MKINKKIVRGLSVARYGMEQFCPTWFYCEIRGREYSFTFLAEFRAES
uniref:Uncharacterized protein n=1 Tax=Rhizophora mucronata TaxID=61149 RepID=A0A2P2NXX1_RHIMU